MFSAKSKTYPMGILKSKTTYHENGPERSAKFRILTTTDLHARLYPYDHYTAQPDDEVGLVRTATLIKNSRRGVENCILVDGGDFLNGSALSDYVAQSKDKAQENPVIAVMNAIGYDVVTVGNHEFNYGLKALSAALEKCNFPVVSSNLKLKNDQSCLDEYVILERSITDEFGQKSPIKIGVVGFAPPQIVLWDKLQLAGQLDAQDIIEAARQVVPKVKRAGADIVIALAHTGIAESNTEIGLENAALQLAHVEGIDAIIAGHQHRIFPSDYFSGIPLVDVERGTINGIPTVMAGFSGSHLGVIDLSLVFKQGKWTVSGHAVSTPAISQRDTDNHLKPLVTNDYQAASAARKGHQKAVSHSNRIVGEIEQNLNSFFSLVGYDLSIRFVLNAQQRIIEQAIQGTENEHLPVLSAAAPFRCGGFGGPDYYTMIRKGAVSVRNIADLYSFPDEICAVKVTGAEVKNWLERSAGIFNRIKTGHHDQCLINPDHPSYYSDTILGVSYVIDPSQPARFDRTGKLINTAHHRIVDLCYNGKPLRDDQVFLIATNSFRAFGGGMFVQRIADSRVLHNGQSLQEALILHLNQMHGETYPDVLNWEFAKLKDTSALFESGVESLANYQDVPQLNLSYERQQENGFQQYRIWLG